MPDDLINVSYIVSAILFILGIKMLGSASTAVRGNRISSLGMLVAVIVTLTKGGLDYHYIIIGLIIGSVIGLVAAKKVQMTGMPELVALFNGFGGLASLLVGWSEFEKGGEGNWFLYSVICIAILIGGITFTGSLVAYLKLSGKVGGNAVVFPFQKFINLLVMLSAVLIGLILIIPNNVFENGAALVWALIFLALLVGVLGVIPIGGGDMPVVCVRIISGLKSKDSLTIFRLRPLQLIVTTLIELGLDIFFDFPNVGLTPLRRDLNSSAKMHVVSIQHPQTINGKVFLIKSIDSWKR